MYRPLAEIIADYPGATDNAKAIFDTLVKDEAEGVTKEYRAIQMVKAIGNGRTKYEDLSTTAKVHCLDMFLDTMIPYEWDEVNDGTVSDLEVTITYWIGDQFWIDQNGDWYDEDRPVWGWNHR